MRAGHVTKDKSQLYLLLAAPEEVRLRVASEEDLAEVLVLLAGQAGLTFLGRTNDVDPGRGELDGLRPVHLVQVDAGGLRQQRVGESVWLEEDCSVMLTQT